MASIVIAGDTSGTVTLAAPATAGTTTLTLPTTNGTVLTSASSVARSQLPAGSVLQVVTSVYSTRQSFSATLGTYYDTGLAATITPSSASNKILVLVTATHQSNYNSTTNAGSSLGLKRGATRIAGLIGAHVATISNAENLSPTGNIIMLDSPATTSPVTYTTLITSVGGSTTVWFNGTYGNTGFDAYITLMEIAA